MEDSKAGSFAVTFKSRMRGVRCEWVAETKMEEDGSNCTLMSV